MDQTDVDKFAEFNVGDAVYLMARYTDMKPVVWTVVRRYWESLPGIVYDMTAFGAKFTGAEERWLSKAAP